MTLRENEFKQLDALCDRVEFRYGWPAGTLKGKSSRKQVVGHRNQLIDDAVNNRKMTIKNLSIYFRKTVQSIHDAVRRAKEEKDYHQAYNEVHHWLCDV